MLSKIIMGLCFCFLIFFSMDVQTQKTEIFLCQRAVLLLENFTYSATQRNYSCPPAIYKAQEDCPMLCKSTGRLCCHQDWPGVQSRNLLTQYLAEVGCEAGKVSVRRWLKCWSPSMLCNSHVFSWNVSGCYWESFCFRKEDLYIWYFFLKEQYLSLLVILVHLIFSADTPIGNRFACKSTRFSL